jgi:hypothetical protein
MISSLIYGSYPVNLTCKSVVRNGTIYGKFTFITMRLDRLYDLFNGCHFLQLQPADAKKIADRYYHHFIYPMPCTTTCFFIHT